MSTVIEDIINQTEQSQRRIIREAYLSVARYLISFCPDLGLNNTKIAELDAGSRTTTTSRWPVWFETNRDGEPMFVLDLLTYKGVSVHLFVSMAGLTLKFPTVTFDGYRVSTWTLRAWKRAMQPNHYSRYEEPHENWESVAFAENRLPTREEMRLNANWRYNSTKKHYHMFKIPDTFNGDIAELFESEYRKYLASVKKLAGFNETNEAAMYKQYITYRGTPELAKHQAAQAKPQVK